MSHPTHSFSTPEMCVSHKYHTLGNSGFMFPHQKLRVDVTQKTIQLNSCRSALRADLGEIPKNPLGDFLCEPVWHLLQGPVLWQLSQCSCNIKTGNWLLSCSGISILPQRTPRHHLLWRRKDLWAAWTPTLHRGQPMLCTGIDHPGNWDTCREILPGTGNTEIVQVCLTLSIF